MFSCPKALCFFMLTMTVAWHRDLLQTGKVRLTSAAFLIWDDNNSRRRCYYLLEAEIAPVLSEFWKGAMEFLRHRRTTEELLMHGFTRPSINTVWQFILFSSPSSSPHISEHLPVEVSLGKTVNYLQAPRVPFRCLPWPLTSFVATLSWKCARDDKIILILVVDWYPLTLICSIKTPFNTSIILPSWCPMFLLWSCTSWRSAACCSLCSGCSEPVQERDGVWFW